MNRRVGGLTVVLLVALVPTAAAAQAIPADVPVELSLVERIAVEAAVVFLMGIGVVGVFPYWGEPAIETARGSAIMSTFFGVVGAVVLVLLGASAWIFSQVMLGWVVAYPLGIAVLTLGFLARAIGFIALGNAVASRFGVTNDWIGLLVGVLAAAVLAVIPYVGVGIALLITIAGMGAVVRTAIGSDHSGKREQSMPPAHQL